MSKNKIVSLLCPIAFFAFGVFIRISTLNMSKRDATFPNIVSYIVIFISIIQFAMDCRKAEHKDRFKDVNFLKIAEFIVAMYLYVFLLKKVGFLIDTLFLTAFTMWALDYKNYKVLAISSIIITGSVYLVFGVLLHVPLPMLKM